jgi:hypothetical protein
MYGSVGRFTIFGTYVFKSNLEHFWQMSLWSPVYVPEIETGRHVKNNAYTVEIKIKWMIRKHIPWRHINPFLKTCCKFTSVLFGKSTVHFVGNLIIVIRIYCWHIQNVYIETEMKLFNFTFHCLHPVSFKRSYVMKRDTAETTGIKIPFRNSSQFLLLLPRRKPEFL